MVSDRSLSTCHHHGTILRTRSAVRFHLVRACSREFGCLASGKLALNLLSIKSTVSDNVAISRNGFLRGNRAENKKDTTGQTESRTKWNYGSYRSWKWCYAFPITFIRVICSTNVSRWLSRRTSRLRYHDPPMFTYWPKHARGFRPVYLRSDYAITKPRDSIVDVSLLAPNIVGICGYAYAWITYSNSVSSSNENVRIRNK